MQQGACCLKHVHRTGGRHHLLEALDAVVVKGQDVGRLSRILIFGTVVDFDVAVGK